MNDLLNDFYIGNTGILARLQEIEEIRNYFLAANPELGALQAIEHGHSESVYFCYLPQAETIRTATADGIGTVIIQSWLVVVAIREHSILSNSDSIERAGILIQSLRSAFIGYEVSPYHDGMFQAVPSPAISVEIDRGYAFYPIQFNAALIEPTKTAFNASLF